MTPNGLVLLDKPIGVTSFRALNPLKRQFGRALGHTGTLDQFASGLLVVLTGKFTKFTPLFTAYDKVYEAVFEFGVETDTLDPTGKVIFSANVPDEEAIVGLSNAFKGPLDQVPPQYSAIHVDGKRAYERVRGGETPVLVPRRIEIYQLDVLEWQKPHLKVRIHCSKGTYVRALARDWGRLAGCGAHVKSLVRKKVGPFELPEEPAVFRDELQTLALLNIPLLPVHETSGVLRGMEPVSQAPSLATIESERVALVAPEGSVLAVVCREGNRWSYLFVKADSKQ